MTGGSPFPQGGFVTMKLECASVVGVVVGDDAALLTDVSGRLVRDLKSLLADQNALSGAAQRARLVGRRIALRGARVLPPILAPGKIVCVGLNYKAHAAEVGKASARYPSLFTRFADGHVAHGEPIVVPLESQTLDFEGELAVVIGKHARRISAEAASEVIGGFSCFNDGSVRDWQFHTPQYTPGKNFPRTGAFGPALVLMDAVGDPAHRRLTTRLNGAVMQSAQLGDMIYSIEEIVSYVSTFTPLAPGDVIVTGTPAGVGFKREPPVYLRPGDIVTVEIEGVGRLENPVRAEAGPC